MMQEILRRELKSSAQDAADSAKKAGEYIKNSAQYAADSAKKAGENVKSSVNDAAKSVKNAAKDNNSSSVEKEEVMIKTDLETNQKEVDLYKTQAPRVEIKDTRTEKF